MNKMSLIKRSIAILLVAAMVTALGGCGNGTSIANTQTASKTESESIARESEAAEEEEETKQEETEIVKVKVLDDDEIETFINNWISKIDSEFIFAIWDKTEVEPKVISDKEKITVKNGDVVVWKPGKYSINSSSAFAKDMVFYEEFVINILNDSLEITQFNIDDEFGNTILTTVLASDEQKLIAYEFGEEDVDILESPEGLTYDDAKTYFTTEDHLGRVEFLLWNEEKGKIRKITGEAVIMEEGEELRVFIRTGSEYISFELTPDNITSSRFEVFSFDQFIDVEVGSEPIEITVKVEIEEYEGICESFCILLPVE